MPRFAHLAVLAVSIAAVPVVADELHVPSEYATIQGAIDAALDGDEIVLAPGVYTEPVDLSGKNVVLRSTDPGDLATVEATELDFTANPPARVRVLDPTNTLATAIDGLTLRFTEADAVNDPHLTVVDGSLTISRANLIGNAQVESPIVFTRAQGVFDRCRDAGLAPNDYNTVCVGTTESNVLFQDCDLDRTESLLVAPLADTSEVVLAGCHLARVATPIGVNGTIQTMPATRLEHCTVTVGVTGHVGSPRGLTIADCAFAPDPEAEEPRLSLTVESATLTISRMEASEPIVVELTARSDGRIRVRDCDWTLNESGHDDVFEITEGSLELDRVALDGFLPQAGQFIDAEDANVSLRDVTADFTDEDSFPVTIRGATTLAAERTSAGFADPSYPFRVDAYGPGTLVSLVETSGFAVFLGRDGSLFDLGSTLAQLSKSTSDDGVIALDATTIEGDVDVNGGSFYATDTTFDGGNLPTDFAGDRRVRLYDTRATIVNAVITGCTGQSALLCSGDSDVLVLDTRFEDNSGNSAGVVRTYATARAKLVRCSIEGCGSNFGPAVARATTDSRLEFVECVMAGNSIFYDPDDTDAEGIVIGSSSVPVVLNACTIWGNQYYGDPVQGNVTITNSIVQGVTPFDPLVVREPDPGDDGWYNWRNTPDIDESANNDYGDLRLLPGSPAIDAGDTAALPPDAFDLDGDGDTAEPLPIDFAGNPRTVDDPATPDTGPGPAPIVDLGAYEFQPPPCPADLDSNGVLNLDDIATFATAFVGGDPLADLDANGTLNLDDVAAFAQGFLAGCP